MSTVFLNGRFLPTEEASISPLDRGFLFADGIYEVIPAYQGQLFRLDKHLDRLQHSLDAVRLPLPEELKRNQLTDAMNELIDRNGGGNLSLYLQITRGCPTQRDHGFPTEAVTPTVFMMTTPMKAPLVDQLEQAKGVSAITAEDTRWARCDIKSVSLLPNLLLRQQAVDVGAAEAILIKEGFVTEGAASNIFIVKENTLITPPLKPAILSGITRDFILELAQKHQLPFKEASVSRDDLLNADEVWASSSTKEILPIVKIDGKPVGSGEVGPTWKTVAKLYFNHKASLLGTDLPKG